MERRTFEVRGVVQGVGFRPHAFRLARDLALSGWIRNDGDGLRLELEGPPDALDAFAARLVTEAPPGAAIEHVETARRTPSGAVGLEIRASRSAGAAAGVQADLAPCAACLRELFDPADRRHRYPFLSCTQCGPRFTILERLPYDRANTTLKAFPLCGPCQAEFDDPDDRRFHAQPLACGDCGPQASLRGADGTPQAGRDAAVVLAGRLLRDGGVLALKGLGGFQLVARADDADAVARVRGLKRRPRKPLAVMVRDLEAARRLASLEAGEAELLSSPAAPIVLVPQQPGAGLGHGVAPGLRRVGLLLPATPLHHLLAAALDAPLVVTSANRPGEPLPKDEAEARAVLGGAVDGYLVHDRPIAQRADDSVARWAAGRPLLLRRARGYAPLPVPLAPGCRPRGQVLACGAHLKATLALAQGDTAWLSPHVGDLQTLRAQEVYGETLAALLELRRADPARLACDLHPGYASTRAAEASGRPLERVQHHEAHALAVVAEHGTPLPALAVTWDGTGHGDDGTVWGGEAFRVSEHACARLARLRPFRLPGGEQAVREPRRAALGLLLAADAALDWGRPGLANLAAAFDAETRWVLPRAAARGVNAPWTSSVGRLFDAVAALAGLAPTLSYEAEAACLLEQAVDPDAEGAYGLALDTSTTPWELDWRPALDALLVDLAAGAPRGVIAARFHRALVDAVVALARASELTQAVLGGGCFQNRVLLEGCVAALRGAGIAVDWPCRLPPGDGGLAVGQLAAAARRGA